MCSVILIKFFTLSCVYIGLVCEDTYVGTLFVTFCFQQASIMESPPSPTKGTARNESFDVGYHNNEKQSETPSTEDQETLDHLSESLTPQKKSFKFIMTVVMLCTTSVIVAMDSVIVAASLPAITVSLEGSSLEAFWIGTSYLLAQTVRILSTVHSRYGC